MAARRENRTQVNPKPIGYWVARKTVPSREFTAELRDVDPASIRAGESCPPAFSDFQAAVDAARLLAYQWSAWVSVVAQRVCGFLVLTGAHEEFLTLHLILVQVGPEGELVYPWATG